MNLSVHIGPLVALIAGVLILILHHRRSLQPT